MSETTWNGILKQASAKRAQGYGTWRPLDNMRAKAAPVDTTEYNGHGSTSPASGYATSTNGYQYRGDVQSVYKAIDIPGNHLQNVQQLKKYFPLLNNEDRVKFINELITLHKERPDYAPEYCD